MLSRRSISNRLGNRFVSATVVVNIFRSTCIRSFVVNACGSTVVNNYFSVIRHGIRSWNCGSR